MRKEGNDAPIHEIEAHKSEINCVAFHPSHENLLVTASADSTVALWDMRNLKERLHTLTGHTGDLMQVQWSPHCESVLASAAADRRVMIWDLSRIGMEQTEEDSKDGPAELLFIHSGHTSKVSDLSWNPNDPWVISSVAEDNVLQVWQPASSIYEESEDGDAMQDFE